MATTASRFPQILVKWCGQGVSYAEGLRIQKKHLEAHFASDHSDQPKNVLLLLEHSPVYTIGIRTRSYSDEDERRLRSLGADFYKSDRGGLITFHGPGQLVAYPIFNLEDFRSSGGVGGGPRGVKWYVCQLERSLIRLCKEYGLTAEAPGPPLTGVWVNGRKIAAIGVHATRRSFVSHGLALNCDTDLKWFDHIVPCGLEGKEVTSLSKEVSKRDEATKEVTLMDVINPFVKAFTEQFRCEAIFESDIDLSQRVIPG